MRTLRLLAVTASAVLLGCGAALADGFTKRDYPKYQDIEPRLVYGQAVYDLGFVGAGPKAKASSARSFLESIVRNRFGGSKGNYIATLTLSFDGKPVVVEPLLAANWESEKFLFITTSEKQSIVINRDGVLLDNLVIENATNKVGVAVKVYYSKNANVDLTLFKAISDLSKTAAIASFAPGAPGIEAAFKPFLDILGKLLSNYKEETIVESTVGAFTLLDDGMPNELSYSDGRISINIYLKTKNSQLPRNFDAATATFKAATSPDAVLASVSSGEGAARMTVLDIMSRDGEQANAPLRNFLLALQKGELLPDGSGHKVNSSCIALKQRLNRLVTTRDAALVYWAVLKVYGSEILRYGDGKECGNEALTGDLRRRGLELGADWNP